MSQPQDVDVMEEKVLQLSGEIDRQQPFTLLRMPDGKMVRVATAALAGVADSAPVPSVGASDAPIVIPLVEERLEVSRRTVPTGTVRLHKTVQEYHEALDEPLAARTYDIERVILNQVVDAAPAVRVEGETTIYPLVEERLVLTKQLVLTEEVRVTQRDAERRDTQVVTLRREHLEVERIALG